MNDMVTFKQVEDKVIQKLVKNFDWLNPLKCSVVLPAAFTGKGFYMLATILKSS
jgi:hypothetical protein